MPEGRVGHVGAFEAERQGELDIGQCARGCVVVDSDDRAGDDVVVRAPLVLVGPEPADKAAPLDRCFLRRIDLEGGHRRGKDRPFDFACLGRGEA